MIEDLNPASGVAANNNLAALNLPIANQKLALGTAKQAWAIGLGGNTLVTANFGPQETVLLHMVSQIAANTKVLWVDFGYNTPQTHAFAEKVVEQLNLNLAVYTPAVTAARRDAVLGGISNIDDPAHAEFTEQFKLEPFKRSMAEIFPNVWFSALRREQSPLRQHMDTVAHGPKGTIKI